MEDDREAGELLFDLVEDVEGERRGNQAAGLRVTGALLRGELVGAVGGADGDGEGVAAGAGGEVDDLFRLGVMGFRGSTVTSNWWAYSTTFLVRAMFSSYGREEASIITELKPMSTQSLHSSKLSP